MKKKSRTIFGKDVMISGTISAIGALIFWPIAAYVLFVARINPWWYKFIIIVPFGLFIYIFIGVADRWVFKKLGRRSPKSSSVKS